ncbi:hypothetical protein SteCoe_598 [Stentor coeruleus]|uniref:Macro domain-containing protein n=1 Tax=Stentor coeruleus TaxID=5963 RepID=A0A1R2D3N5_9CILI|nr:hypothetical protein SteCoe_598 [Stentor coeruleus]
MIGRVSIKLIRGDIAKVGGGVIMSPTNGKLSRNSGLTTYLVDSAGHRVFMEMNALKRDNEELQPGEIAITSSGNLPAIHLFHTCMPPYNRDDPEPLVRMFIERVLRRSEELKVDSVIFPCLPKDAYGFTPEHCAFGYFSGVIDYVEGNSQSGLREVKFVTLDKNATEVFKREADRRFGVKEKKSFWSFGKKGKKDKVQEDIELH